MENKAHDKPRCPNCNQKLRWNWNQDSYWLMAKKQFSAIDTFNPEEVDMEVDVHSCSCGQALGLVISTEHGGEVVNHPLLADVDWDKYCHNSL